jgi:hypothetical protein
MKFNSAGFLKPLVIMSYSKQRELPIEGKGLVPLSRDERMSPFGIEMSRFRTACISLPPFKQ